MAWFNRLGLLNLGQFWPLFVMEWRIFISHETRRIHAPTAGMWGARSCRLVCAEGRLHYISLIFRIVFSLFCPSRFGFLVGVLIVLRDLQDETSILKILHILFRQISIFPKDSMMHDVSLLACWYSISQVYMISSDDMKKCKADSCHIQISR